MDELTPEILNISYLIKKYEKSFWGFRTRRVPALKIKEFRLLKNKLIETDQEFNEKHQENLNLLKGEELIFNVTGKGRDQFSSHALQLEGRIFPNGFLYVDTGETNTNLGGMSSGVYPEEFEGVIDSLGRIKLQMTKSGFAILGGRVPKKFKATVSESGHVKLIMIDSEFEFTGNYFINNLMCDPFNKDSVKRHKFISNKKKLTQKIRVLRNEILEVK